MGVFPQPIRGKDALHFQVWQSVRELIPVPVVVLSEAAASGYLCQEPLLVFVFGILSAEPVGDLVNR